jgi:hypothetical protein
LNDDDHNGVRSCGERKTSFIWDALPRSLVLISREMYSTYLVTYSTYCTWTVEYLRIRTPMRRSGPVKGLTELHPALTLSYTGPLIVIKRTLISTIRSLIGSHLFRRQVSH